MTESTFVYNSNLLLVAAGGGAAAEYLLHVARLVPLTASHEIIE